MGRLAFIGALALAVSAEAQTTTRVLAQGQRGPGTFTSSEATIPANTQQIKLQAVMTNAQRDNPDNTFRVAIEVFNEASSAWEERLSQEFRCGIVVRGVPVTPSLTLATHDMGGLRARAVLSLPQRLNLGADATTYPME